MQSAQWAEEEFGTAVLGDSRRTRRVVCVAQELDEHPAGTVTRACRTSASQEGAFRLLENSAVRAQALRDCVTSATSRRCAGRSLVIVAVDATSLHITDRSAAKGLGSVGASGRGARGVQIMTALAVTAEGAPLGILGQEMWLRTAPSAQTVAKRKQRAQGGESERWLSVLESCRTASIDDGIEAMLWYQLDRGADCWQVLEYANEVDVTLTVRAAQDRKVDESVDRLWKHVENTRRIETMRIHVPKRQRRRRHRRKNGRRIVETLPSCRARWATLDVRAASVPLVVQTAAGKQTMTFNAVLVRERNATASERVEWLLLTTHTIATKLDVFEVVRAYGLRWRIEDFHRVWKRGRCRVEDTQLRSREAIYKWATLLASVATRAMRLTHQARQTPDVPASSALTAYEIEAVLALRRPKNHDGSEPTLAQAVRWVADLGGYTGPWNGPPGPTVIGRGLQDVLAAARALEYRDKKR